VKQRLSERRERRIAAMIGEPVECAYTRGGWPHFTAEVWTKTRRLFVNYQTGQVDSVTPVTVKEDGWLSTSLSRSPAS
jgi:hypothetical protein